MQHSGFKWILALTLAVWAVVTHAADGYYYEAQTTTTAEGKKPQLMTVTSWIAGDNARVEFTEGPKKGTFSKGSYLLTTDGGRTTKLVDPKKETWTEIDVEAMLSAVSSLMGDMNGMASMSFENVYHETLLEEPGEELLGYSTTHRRWKSGVTIKIKVMGFGTETTMDMLHDAWFTDAIGDAGFRAWLSPFKFSTGDEDMDKMMRGEMASLKGFPLKSITTTTTSGKKGKQSASTSETVVTELREEDVDDERFTIPSHYEHKPMMPDGQ